MPSNESTYLAWSKTIEETKFRAFAFTDGCGECEACRAAAADGSPPVWAIFMQPRADRDEWTLCTVALGHFKGDDRSKLEDAVIGLGFTNHEGVINRWRKLAALVGVPWHQVSAEPFTVAREQKEAGDEFFGHGLLGRIFDAADEDELREVREEHRQGASSFGVTFGKLLWEVFKRTARRNRGQ